LQHVAVVMQSVDFCSHIVITLLNGLIAEAQIVKFPPRDGEGFFSRTGFCLNVVKIIVQVSVTTSLLLMVSGEVILLS